MKTYTNRANAIRAARTALGADAIPSIDFTVEKVAGGQYAWAPRASGQTLGEMVGYGEGEPSAEFVAGEAEDAAEWLAAQPAPPAPAEAAIEALRAEAENAETPAQEMARIDAERAKALADAEWARAVSAAEAAASAEVAEAGVQEHTGWNGPADAKAAKAAARAEHRAAQKAAKAEKAAASKAPRKPSKLDLLIEMVLQPGGAVMADMLAASGWTACHTTVRQECAKRGLGLEVTGKGKQAVWQAAKPAE